MYACIYERACIYAYMHVGRWTYIYIYAYIYIYTYIHVLHVYLCLCIPAHRHAWHMGIYVQKYTI